MKFVLALGNRPKGEKVAYVITLWSVTLPFPTVLPLKVVALGYTLYLPFTSSCVPLRLLSSHSR